MGRPVEVVVRSEAQLRKVIDGDPFAGVANDGAKYVVLFLTGTPDVAAVKDVHSRAAEFEPEQFVHDGTEFYVWCPNSLRDAKLPQNVTPITILPVDYVKLFCGWRTPPCSGARKWNLGPSLTTLGTGVSAQKKLLVARIK